MSASVKNLKSKVSNFPASPGIYQFLSGTGKVLYIGKAKNLRSRVRQYFGGQDERPQIPFLMAEAVDVGYTVLSSELEAAFLENTLIKQYLPKYNIDLRDDKNYAFITIDYSSEIPSIGYARKIEEKFEIRNSKFEKNFKSKILNHKSVFFGPYSAAHKIKQTLNLVRKIFPYCANNKVGSRPCFYYYLHRCPGVCIGKMSLDDYRLYLNNIIAFLQGDFQGIIGKLKKDMAQAAKVKKFELAARLRDQLKSLTMLTERQNVILAKKVDWDVVSLAASDGYACVNLFKIRGGKMFDKENFVYEYPEKTSGTAENYGTQIAQRFLEQYYLETSSVPKIIYTEAPASDAALIVKILRSRFKKSASVISPQKGQAKKLVDLGQLNAEEYLRNWLSDKAGNLDKINNALEQLKEVLKLPAVPKRIECYDISNTQGTNPVGSMVVFIDGLPAKSEYRKFKIQGKQTPNDFAMMKEMLHRRLMRSPRVGKIQAPNTKHPTNSKFEIRNSKFWPLPDLIVIDGGKGQLGVAVETINNLRLTINSIGLAKRIEEIFLPGQHQPIILSHDQPALQLLQRLRDEAHRFGITFHRQLRSKQAVKSALDEIPGIGPKTKKLLKTKFGTVGEIKKTSLDELAKVVGEKLAVAIKQNL